MTHELGHTHGLYDMTGLTYFYQTMYGYGRACESWQRTLGTVDLRTIRLQY